MARVRRTAKADSISTQHRQTHREAVVEYLEFANRHLQLRIDAMFAQIKAEYFPRWDREGRWRVLIGHDEKHPGSSGYCNSRLRTIFLDPQIRQMPEVGVRGLIIHEICHDVGAAGHNRKWAMRVMRAAERAQRRGDVDLVEQLRAYILAETGDTVLQEYDVSNVHSLARNLIRRDPSITLAGLIQRISRHFGHAAAKVRRDFGHILDDVWTRSRL